MLEERAGRRLRDDEDGLGGGIEAGWGRGWMIEAGLDDRGGAGMIEAGLGISMTFFERKKPGDSKISGQRLLHFTHNYSLKY